MADPKKTSVEKSEERLGWLFVLPALGAIVLIALFPLAWTIWESLHLNDLRMPWRGQPFIGLDNYFALMRDWRFWTALGHTAFFTVTSVTLELVLGLILALALNRAFVGRGFVRTIVLLPWAIPTVVAGLLWQFIFDSQAGIVNAVLIDIGVMSSANPFVWLSDAFAAWVPIILADVWKTTPFVALLLLAGLQNIDRSLYEAAEIDGATPWQQFVNITLPLLKPAILIVLIFRTLDAFRVFDLIYVLTQGGPGTATEPIAMYTFIRLRTYLQFGYGSALSVVIFLITFLLAVLYMRALKVDLTEKPQ